MSVALDTNVVVRLLVADDVDQAQAAHALIQATHSAGGQAFIHQGVLLETEWVLRSRYRLSREEIAFAFSALLETQELEVHRADIVEEALYLFKDRPGADFADCMHVANALHGGRTFFTFDQKAARLPGAALVPETGGPT